MVLLVLDGLMLQELQIYGHHQCLKQELEQLRQQMDMPMECQVLQVKVILLEQVIFQLVVNRSNEQFQVL